MSNKQKTSEQSVKTAKVVRRVVVSFFLFTTVFTGILLISELFVLPRLTRVEIDGTERSVSDVKELHTKLSASLIELEEERNKYVLPLQNELWNIMKSIKYDQSGFVIQKERVERAADDFVMERKKVVFIDSLHFDAETNVLNVRGDVRNVGPRSMTILAQFTESVRALPFVSSVQNPNYSREYSEEKGTHSPFVLRIHTQK